MNLSVDLGFPFIQSIADKLRGSYRAPHYHQVMLPMIVLHHRIVI